MVICCVIAIRSIGRKTSYCSLKHTSGGIGHADALKHAERDIRVNGGCPKVNVLIEVFSTIYFGESY